MKEFSKNQEMVDVFHVDTLAAAWREYPLREMGATLDVQPLVSDPDTRMQVMKVVYRAGFTNSLHTHNCARGIYVLEGTLSTYKGDFPAGFLCGFPRGAMEHGETEEQD